MEMPLSLLNKDTAQRVVENREESAVKVERKEKKDDVWFV
jgi:hypothetical protein